MPPFPLEGLLLHSCLHSLLLRGTTFLCLPGRAALFLLRTSESFRFNQVLFRTTLGSAQPLLSQSNSFSLFPGTFFTCPPCNQCYGSAKRGHNSPWCHMGMPRICYSDTDRVPQAEHIRGWSPSHVHCVPVTRILGTCHRQTCRRRHSAVSHRLNIHQKYARNAHASQTHARQTSHTTHILGAVYMPQTTCPFHTLNVLLIHPPHTHTQADASSVPHCLGQMFSS